jgi:ABC-type amino acid transport substrate-binding protein
MTILARGRYEYFITFTDNYLRFKYVYLVRRKSNFSEKFKEYKAEVDRQISKQIKALRSYCGGEYLLGESKNYLVHHR